MYIVTYRFMEIGCILITLVTFKRTLPDHRNAQKSILRFGMEAAIFFR